MSTVFVRCSACGNDTPEDEAERRHGLREGGGYVLAFYLCAACAWEARNEERDERVRGSRRPFADLALGDSAYPPARVPLGDALVSRLLEDASGDDGNASLEDLCDYCGAPFCKEGHGDRGDERIEDGLEPEARIAGWGTR